MAYYQISGGRITSFNGVIAISSPINVDFEVSPRAEIFHKTIQSCGDEISLTLSDNGILHVKSGGFSARVPCLAQPATYHAVPEGDVFPLPGGFTNACRQVFPVVAKSTITAAAWASVIQAENGCLTVTNNSVVLQSWVGFETPPFDIIRDTAQEVIRIGEDPTHVQISESSVTFHYSDGRWLRTQRSYQAWPSEHVNRILDAPVSNEMLPVPFNLFDVLEMIMPFTPANNAAVYFQDGRLTTGDNFTGAECLVEGLCAGPVFNGKNLFMLRDFAEEIDFAAYPKPSGFRGANCRGVIIGLTS
jgi:hypothetical protein